MLWYVRCFSVFFFSSRRRHTRCALVTGVQTCALPISMLERLTTQPPDALLALIKMYAADTRPDKIDLGVGVYRTGRGDTPVFAAIKAAEQTLVDEQDSKSYLGPEGDMGSVHALMPYIFGADATQRGRISGRQTHGETG